MATTTAEDDRTHHRSLSGSGPSPIDNEEMHKPQVATAAEYVAAMGGRRPLDRVLICNNGIAVGKGERSEMESVGF